MNKLDICNNALDLVGQGIHIDSFDENSKEADVIRRNYQSVVDRALASYYFSFARKDEVITENNLIKDYVSLPWKYSYTIPTDCMTILKLERIAKGLNDNNELEEIEFNFRNIKNKKCIVTNEKAPFVIQYQCYIEDESLFSPMFIEAIEYLLAGKIAPALIHGTSGMQIGQALIQAGLGYLEFSAGQDAQQGANSSLNHTPSLIKCRE